MLPFSLRQLIAILSVSKEVFTAHTFEYKYLYSITMAIITEKMYLLMQVQAVSKNKNCKVYTCWPGSVHDSRVLKNSPIFLRLYLPEGSHFLGDWEYPTYDSKNRDYNALQKWQWGWFWEHRIEHSALKVLSSNMLGQEYMASNGQPFLQVYQESRAYIWCKRGNMIQYNIFNIHIFIYSIWLKFFGSAALQENSRCELRNGGIIKDLWSFRSEAELQFS